MRIVRAAMLCVVGAAVLCVVVAAIAGAAAPAAGATARPTQVAPPERILIVGDSTGESIFPYLRDAASARSVEVRSIARIGCSVIDGLAVKDDGQPFRDPVTDTRVCANTTDTRQEQAVAEWSPQLIVWTSAWEAVPDRILDGGFVAHFGTIAGNRAILGKIDQAVARLDALGGRVVFLPVAPNAYPSLRGILNPYGDASKVELAKMLRSYASQDADHVSLIDVPAMLCPNGTPCPAEPVPGVRPRPLDGSHFDGPGAAWMADQLMPMLLGPLPPPPPAAAPCVDASVGTRRPSSAGTAACPA